jgi:membrane protease YdiL (CAAX protease family)
MNESLPPSSRAGRTADTCIVVFALTFPTLLTYVYFTLLAAAPTIVQHTAFGILKTIQFGFPLAWYLGIQRRRLSLRPGPVVGLGTGFLFGAVVVVAMWCLYKYVLTPAGMMAAAIEPIQSKISGFGVNTIPRYAALAVFYSVIHSGLEEYYWRWFVFGQLSELVRLPAAVIVSSLGFTAHHVLLLGTFFGWHSPLTWLFSLAIMVGGFAWAMIYHRFGSIYPVWIGHLLVDAGIFLIGYDLVGIGAT